MRGGCSSTEYHPRNFSRTIATSLSVAFAASGYYECLRTLSTAHRPLS